MLSWLHDWLWIQQDYFWFLAGMGWLTVGLIWWQQRRTGGIPGWVPWSAGAGVAIAVTQIANVVTPIIHIVPYQDPSIRADMCVGIGFAAGVAGWWISRFSQTRRGRVVAYAVSVATLAAAVWRYDHPHTGVILIMVAQISGALCWWRGRQTAPGVWRIAMAVTAIAALINTIPPVSTDTLGPQRWFDLSPVGPWAAIAQCLSVLACLAAVFRSSRESSSGAFVPTWREIGFSSLWLAAGFAFAIAVGRWGLQELEKSTVGRARSAAALLSMEAVEMLLNEQLQINEVEWLQITEDMGAPVSYSDYTAKNAGPLTNEIWRIAKANLDARWVLVSRMDKGWLFAAAFARERQNKPTLVPLIRRSNDDDVRAWFEARADLLRPMQLSWGEMSVARAPILNRAAEMVGWLEFHLTANQWIAAQAQPRSLAYLIIALGLVVGQQRVVQKRRVLERDRAEARADALAQANELKTTFLAKVSHELRTPLQSFLGYTELLLSEANPRDRERLLAMREHAGLMSRLVNDLIDLSAAECGQFQLLERPVDLAELVTQAAESLRPSAEAKGLFYAVAVAADIPAVLAADPQRIRQVVLNLVGNAIKYTDRGRIDVSLACPARDEQTATIALRVADTGPGVPPAVQPHLFAAFARLAPTAGREGTGLGLAIVAAVCKAMGGDITVASDGHSGSTFTARWCLRLTTAAVATTPGRVPLHGRRVLVVDDNSLVRDLFIAYLTECGAACAAARDGVEAIDRLRREPFDAVVLDLAMPRLDGLATVRKLRTGAGRKPWRIVGVSAHAGGAEHREALAAGMDGFLTKPVALPDLARALAPTAGWLPSEPAFAGMREHFAQRFRVDARTQADAIAAALSGQDWPQVVRAAHHLHNSAGVVGDTELARGCAALEQAAQVPDAAAVAIAWELCRRALAPWLENSSET